MSKAMKAGPHPPGAGKFRKARHERQRVGKYGERLVCLLADKSGHWLARSQEEDFGVDLELELTAPAVAGEILKVQVKSSTKVERDGSSVKCLLPRSLVHLGENLRVPVLLAVVEESTDRTWYLWIQRWWLQQRENGVRLDRLPENITVLLPDRDRLPAGLDGELRRIARGQTREQLVLSLSDAVRGAVRHNDSSLLASLVDVLARIGPLPDPFPIGMVINRALRLGAGLRGTDEGANVSRTLFELCRAFGDRFTAGQIDRLVWRGTGYSRTGIDALGLLYTNFPEATVARNLSARYAEEKDPRPAYYCALRERHPTVTDFELARLAAGFAAVGLRFHGDPFDLLDKIANRGASAILDHLAPP